MTMLLLAAVGAFVSYWMIRSAVHHGILDAEESRQLREKRTDV
jgi:hypothetical protein